MRRPNREVEVIEATGCMVWKGSFNSQGKPITRYQGRQLQVPRWLLEEIHGPLPISLSIRQGICGTSSCIAPAHAIIKAPRSAMRLARVEPRTYRALMASLRAAEFGGLCWDTGRPERMAAPPETLRHWANAFDVPYYVALAAYSELVREDAKRKRKEDV